MAVQPSIDRAEWPGYRVRVGSTDITRLPIPGHPDRDAPIIVQEWSNNDPGGHDSASFLLPMFTWADLADLETVAPWYADGALVTVETREDHTLLYRGSIDTLSPSADGLVMTCDGDVIGPLSTQMNNFLLSHQPEDTGFTIAKIVSGHTSSYVHTDDLTGFVLDRPGSISDSRWARVMDLLAMSQHRDGTQYTLLPSADDPLRYEVAVRDMTTVHYTARFGAPGVDPSLSWDIRSHVTAWWGEGQRSDGGRWYNMKYPKIGPQEAADYPMAGGATFGLGTTNADTTSGDGISVLVRNLAGYGLAVVEARGIYTREVRDAVEALQEDRGLTQTGVMNPATWAALFSTATENQSLYGAQRTPLTIQENTRKFDRNADGVIVGINDDFDASVREVHEFIGFGSGIEKSDARDWTRAQRVMQNTTGREWSGSVTFTTSPAECHKYEMRAGKNILDSESGLLFHIARVSVDPQAGTVTCDVSTRGRDYLDLATLILRNREARRNPARRWAAQLSRRSSQSQDMTSGWDYEGGAGLIRNTECAGGEWTVVPVFAGRNGSIASIHLETVSSITEYATLICARPITANRLNALIPAPLQHRTDKDSWVSADGVWQTLFGEDEGVGDLGPLADRKFIMYAAGTASGVDEDGNDIPALPCGYWPHQGAGKASDEALGSNLTGVWKDDAGFDYYTKQGEPFLFVCVWMRNDTTLRGRLETAMVDGGM